jgi:ketosteroid isomerase-like protein
MYELNRTKSQFKCKGLVSTATVLAVILIRYDPPHCRGFRTSSPCIFRSITIQTCGCGCAGCARPIHSGLDDLDWEHFRLAFDDNATVFYPRAMPRRANGHGEFEKAFKTVFQQIRDGKTAAPYMDIQPREMRIQFFGDVAIATFHLDDRAGFLNRRTIVLNKTEKGWKIVHLHASEVSVTGIGQ